MQPNQKPTKTYDLSDLSWTATCEKCGSAAMPVPMAVPPKLEVQNLRFNKNFKVGEQKNTL